MQRTLVRDLRAAAGNADGVRVVGWVESVRGQKTVEFLVLRDATGQVQVTQRRPEGQSPSEGLAKQLTRDSTVEVEGVVALNPAVRLGQLEIIPSKVRILSVAEPLPVADNADLDARLDWRFVDLRSPRNQLIFRVQTLVEQAMRDHWRSEGFVEIHSPKLMGSPSESGAELFELEYFGKTAYLSQSPQFYKQMAIAAGFDRVFEIGPVFWANPSFTSRHDTEFTSVDVEMAWIDSVEEVMEAEERWLASVLRQVKQSLGDEIERVFGVPVVVPRLPFPRVPLADALNLVASEGHLTPGSLDLDPEGERTVARHVQQTQDHQFVFVTRYPAEVRPFYHMRYENEPTLTMSFDLLWKGLEVTTGAKREHRYEVLKAQATEKGLNLGPIDFYLDFFKYGVPPHGGFGFGLTRMLMSLLGVSNVREVTFLHRSPTRLTP